MLCGTALVACFLVDQANLVAVATPSFTDKAQVLTDWVRAELQPFDISKLPPNTYFRFRVRNAGSAVHSSKGVADENAATVRLKSSDTIIECQLWFSSQRLWRLNCDTIDANSAGYIDSGVNATAGWQFSSDQICLVDADEEKRPAERDPRNELFAQVSGAIASLTGRVSSSSSPSSSGAMLNAGQIQGEPQKWSVMFSSPRDRRTVYFRYFDHIENCFPIQIDLLSNKNAETIATWKFGPPEAATPIPHTRSASFSNVGTGTVVSYDLLDIRTIAESDVHRFAVTPKPGADDPIRGRVAVKRVLDLRGAGTSMSRGERLATDTEGAGWANQGKKNSDRDHLFMLTLGTCLVAAAGVVVFRFRRKLF